MQVKSLHQILSYHGMLNASLMCEFFCNSLKICQNKCCKGKAMTFKNKKTFLFFIAWACYLNNMYKKKVLAV